MFTAVCKPMRTTDVITYLLFDLLDGSICWPKSSTYHSVLMVPSQMCQLSMPGALMHPCIITDVGLDNKPDGSSLLLSLEGIKSIISEKKWKLCLSGHDTVFHHIIYFAHTLIFIYIFFSFLHGRLLPCICWCGTVLRSRAMIFRSVLNPCTDLYYRNKSEWCLRAWLSQPFSAGF